MRHAVLVLAGLCLAQAPLPGQAQPVSSIHGTKWLDLDGDGGRDAGEPGLAGVTIYSDSNGNDQLDSGEPFAVTMADVPETDFDEAGRYWLELDPGEHTMREVVPDGFTQTFPGAGARDVEVENGAVLEGIDFGNRRRCDVDGNGQVDKKDVGKVRQAKGRRVEPGDPRDQDDDGRIGRDDVLACKRMCDHPRCGSKPKN
jgi:hypothetical protein